MSLNLSTLSITNSIINLENQINDLDVNIADKQDLITPSTEIETLNITSNINLIDNIDPNNYSVLSYNTFNNKQDLITQETTLDGFNIASSKNINFFNPVNQLDVKQLNYTTLNTIDTNFENITISKQDLITVDTTLQLNTLHADVITAEGGNILDLLDSKQNNLSNTSNIVVKSLLVTTDSIITTPSPGNIECDDIIVGGQTLAQIIAAATSGNSTTYPYMLATRNQGINLTVGGTVLGFDVKKFDPENKWNTSNYTYTVPRAGCYFVKVAVEGTADYTMQVVILRNNTSFIGGKINRAVNTLGASIHETSIIIQCDLNDTITSKLNNGRCRLSGLNTFINIFWVSDLY
jgi:hypothetical protein